MVGDNIKRLMKKNYYTQKELATRSKCTEADVEPKSEEGAECPTCHGTGRIGTTDWLTKGLSKKQLAEEKAKVIAEHEQYIKTEYAREIFGEIEKFVASKMPLSIWKVSGDYDYSDGCRDGESKALLDVLILIAELKEKYTEGKE